MPILLTIRVLYTMFNMCGDVFQIIKIIANVSNIVIVSDESERNWTECPFHLHDDADCESKALTIAVG